MTGRELRKSWEKFLLSEGFERDKKANNKRYFIMSDFSQIYIYLDYAMRFYSPECSITLCELGIDAIYAVDAMDQTRPGFYNLMNFRTHELTERLIDITWGR